MTHARRTVRVSRAKTRERIQTHEKIAQFPDFFVVNLPLSPPTNENRTPFRKAHGMRIAGSD
jgi:hypothetical protein